MNDTNVYLAALNKELVELTTELRDLGIQNPDNPKDWIPVPSEPSDAEPDPIDLGDRSEDWQESRGTLDVLGTRFNNVKRALQKIEDGTYGICEISGGHIEADRLTANPAARTCKAHLNDDTNLPS